MMTNSGIHRGIRESRRGPRLVTRLFVKWAVLRSALIAATCVVASISSGTTAHADKAKQELWKVKCQEAVKAKLRDPSSAEFKDVFFHKGTSGVPVTCGRVNAKNGFGGFIGFQRFVSAAEPSLTFLEQEASDFGAVWKAMCVD